ncbi:MAG: M23 family metallopeptidase [Blastocatellales bacterium]
MNLTTARLPRAWLNILLLIPLAATLAACGIIKRVTGLPAAPREIPSPAPSEPSARNQPQRESASTTPSADVEGDSIKPDSNSINLIIPVEGIRPDDLRDTFNKPRSGGRSHNAIDIKAPQGTPVLAAAGGEIVRLFQNKRGGNTIYQLSADKKLVFYYAHLDRYAEDLSVGHYARQGEVIGYVGDTGNAGAGNYHLHFSIWVITDPKKYWKGDNINPYPILRGTK